MKVFKISLLMLVLTFCFSSVFSQSVIGKWKTIDDDTGKAKSLVNVYKKNGKLYGKILKLYNNDEENPLCTECTGAKKNKPIIGMNIINGLSFDDGEWEGDDGILDPGNGKTYDCKLWVEDGKLQVRGYIGFLYRTQEWIRMK